MCVHCVFCEFRESTGRREDTLNHTISGPTRTEEAGLGELPDDCGIPAEEPGQQPVQARPRIALLTPYSGNNLGDAVIQDAMIANIRLRVPGVQFSGITLNCENFVERHGIGAFPLIATNKPFYGMSRAKAEDSIRGQSTDGDPVRKGPGKWPQRVKGVLKSVPGLSLCLRITHLFMAVILRELRHAVEGYRFLRTQNMLVVSGGGQLDDEWGGAWGLPFTLFKWAVLGRIARVPYVVVGVGAGKVTAITSRFFLATALRAAQYRSYRDKNSRRIAAGILPHAATDAVVPDLAFSLPPSELPPPAGIRFMARGRTIVAVSPMAYAKPGSWPYADEALYERYLQQMVEVVLQLLERQFFLVVVWSALSDQGTAVQDLLGLISPESMKRFAGQVYVPTITKWKDLVALLLDVDFLVATRLHSVILGLVACKPTVAISFDPKVDWVMEDLGLTEHLLQIRTFKAEDVIENIERAAPRRREITQQIVMYSQRTLSASAHQYAALAELARAVRGSRNWKDASRA